MQSPKHPTLTRRVGKLHMLIEGSYHDMSDYSRHELILQPISRMKTLGLAQCPMRQFEWMEAYVKLSSQAPKHFSKNCSRIRSSFVNLQFIF